MTARALSDPASKEERWMLESARGCCSFDFTFVDGRGVVEYGDGCHACMNELNAFVLERGYLVRRREGTTVR